MNTVFVNGCFDILHRGHIELFKYAKSLGDYLLVALDSDDRIREHKGASRPHNNIDDRRAILSSIKFIDEVTCFSSDTELESIVKKFAPDNMIVGSDWQDKKVIGSQYAKNVIFFERIDGYSTTKTIQSFSDRR